MDPITLAMSFAFLIVGLAVGYLLRQGSVTKLEEAVSEAENQIKISHAATEQAQAQTAEVQAIAADFETKLNSSHWVIEDLKSDIALLKEREQETSDEVTRLESVCDEKTELAEKAALEVEAVKKELSVIRQIVDSEQLSARNKKRIEGAKAESAKASSKVKEVTQKPSTKSASTATGPKKKLSQNTQRVSLKAPARKKKNQLSQNTQRVTLKKPAKPSSSYEGNPTPPPSLPPQP